MVMAGNENGSGPAASTTDETLTSRLQWLQQRRQALQEKLIFKNNELKNLCIDEAELTGILPPEIPLEPGESPPSFRRRVGTAYTYPQNLINKLKTTEAEESALELERQVQVGIAEAALGIFNDSNESKAVRRKHRLVYQQSQRRLQELDVRLNFIRQGHSGGSKSSSIPRNSQPRNQNQNHQNLLNYTTQQPHPQTSHAKHRSKKPRPPLEGVERVSKSSRGLLQEGGVSLSPLGQEQNYNTYPGTGYHETESQKIAPLSSTLSHYNQNRPPIVQQHAAESPTALRQSPKLLVSNNLNDNHNVYILPDQYRGRTYSHGSNGGQRNNPLHYLETERSYRPVPNTYTEQERLLRYRPIQISQQQQQQQQQHRQQQLLLQNHQQYPENNETAKRYHHHQNTLQFYNQDGDQNVRRYQSNTPEYQSTSLKKNQGQNVQRRDPRPGNSSRNNGPPTDPHQPPGYWVRYEDEIIWCPDSQDQQSGDKFGSLDRRKRNTIQHTNTTVIGNDGDGQTRYHTVAGSKSTSILPRHNVPLNPPQQEQTHSRMLLRTQSLGSVETWNSGHSHESVEKDGVDGGGNIKAKEKGWYETSLDSGPAVSRESLIPAVKKVPRNINQVNYQQDIIDKERTQRYQPPKILEIPAESKILDNNNEKRGGGGGGGLESPQNCTVVQAGKYQPYREVTKPFEMSDFYKYSTKYRKRNAEGNSNSNPNANAGNYNQTQVPTAMGIGGSNSLNTTITQNKLPQDPRVNMMIQMSQELRLDNFEERSLPSPVQKRIYQPLQRMTCQPYNSLRTEESGEEWYAPEKEAASSATLV